METGEQTFDGLLASTWEKYFDKSKNPEDPDSKVFHEESTLRKINDRVVAFYNPRHVS